MKTQKSSISLTFFVFCFLLVKSQANNSLISDNPTHLFHAIKQVKQSIAFHESLNHSMLFDLKNNFAENANNYIMRTLNDVKVNKILAISDPCSQQLKLLEASLKNKDLWALSVLDAFGKPTSGILYGGILWSGEFSECRNITQPSWNGKYCYVALSSLPLKYGICVPDKCSNDDIVQLINNTLSLIPFEPFNLTSINDNLVTCQESIELDNAAYTAIIVVSLLVFCVVFGTFLDVCGSRLLDRNELPNQNYHSFRNPVLIKNEQKETAENILNVNSNTKEQITTVEPTIVVKKKEKEPVLIRVLLSFSAYTNSIKMFTINKSDDQLQCLHGIRVLSLGWVILGHAYLFTLGAADNPLYALNFVKRFSFMIVSNAFFSVDTFFLLSGLLNSYLFMKETKGKNKKITFGLMGQYYLHRIWRITPPYMLVLLCSVGLTRYGSGPLYPQAYGLESPQCRTHWWTNLLYINNLYETDQSCLGVTWYLANDMQFYWFAPIILIPFALSKTKLATIVSLLLLAVNIIVTALLTNQYPGAELGPLGSNPNYNAKIYVTPWCRMGPYIVGILLGYKLFEDKKKDNTKIDPLLNFVYWTLALITLAIMLFGIYPNLGNTTLTISRTANILYQSSSRTIWAMGLSYVIYACLTSNGGFVNSILSWSVWTPLSRLSFSAYLIHLTLIFMYCYIQEHPLHLIDSSLIFLYIGYTVVSYVAAYFISLTFEVPLIGLEKLIFKRH